MSLIIEKAWAPAAAALGTAGRDVARGAGMLARGAVGLVGISTLAAALVLLGNEPLREQLVASTLTAGGLPVAGAGADEEVRPEADSRGSRWSDWLASQPGTAVEPAQEHVTRYLSRRYRVAEGAVRQIVGQATHQVHRLAESGAPPHRTVAQREARDRRRAQSRESEHRRQRAHDPLVEEAAIGPSRDEVGGGTTVVVHPVANPERAGDQRRSARQARHVGGVHVGEACAPLGDGVDVRRGVAVVAVAAEVIGPHRVDVDPENPHSRPPEQVIRGRGRAVNRAPGESAL